MSEKGNGSTGSTTAVAGDIRGAEQRASTIVALDPLAPLIVRSGRPFDNQAGPDAPRFPPPSTLAGCLRTAWARETGQTLGEHLRALPVSGPLLVNRKNQVLVPKPADARYYHTGESVVCVRAEPRDFDDGCDADLPDGLLPVRLVKDVAGKPAAGPNWWGLTDFFAFRRCRRGENVPVRQLAKNGWLPSEADRRTHVAIDRRHGVAEDGKLFQTEGLVLDGGKKARDAAEGGLRLLGKVGEALGPAVVHLGGERRLTSLEPTSQAVWPSPPNGWLQAIVDSGGLCLTLLTPGIFSAGYLPGWLGADLIGSPPTAPGLKLHLRAVATERWEAHSGWDLVARQPRPTRKLAPAGATYWFRVLEGGNERELEALWLANVSDAEQDMLDGFGLTVPAPWVDTSYKETK